MRFRICLCSFSKKVFLPCVSEKTSEISLKHRAKLLSNAALSCFTLCLIYTRQGHHYSSSHLQHQARSIIFLENHYGCVFPWGRSYGGENRSSGMTVSSDLITSGAKPDSGK